MIEIVRDQFVCDFSCHQFFSLSKEKDTNQGRKIPSIDAQYLYILYCICVHDRQKSSIIIIKKQKKERKPIEQNPV